MQCGVALKTRDRTNATAWFLEIVASLAKLPAGRHVVDGEVCVLDDLADGLRPARCACWVSTMRPGRTRPDTR
jgi:hypothetical protein